MDFSGILEHIKHDLNQYQYPLMDSYDTWGAFKNVMDVENTPRAAQSCRAVEWVGHNAHSPLVVFVTVFQGTFKTLQVFGLRLSRRYRWEL